MGGVLTAVVLALTFALVGGAAVSLGGSASTTRIDNHSNAITIESTGGADVTTTDTAPPTLLAPGTATARSNSAAFFVSGVGAGGATVKIFDGATLIATVAADSSGFYSASVSLTVGSHSLTANQVVGAVTSDASPAVSVLVSSGARVQQGGKLTGGGESGAGGLSADVALSADGNTALMGGPDDNGSIGAAWVYTRSGSTWSQQGAKLTGDGEIGAAGFGASVALSADGNTALIGGYADDGSIGAAWVFTRSGATWTQQAKLTGDAEIGEAAFGVDVDLSADGNTAVVGGFEDDGVAGAVWVFTRSGGSWSQQGSKLTGSGENGASGFGGSVSVSSDGNTALIGGPFDDTTSQFGAVWVFTRSGDVWSQQGSKLTGAGVSPGGWFGWSVALSGDGNTALIGSYPNSSFAGATWVFTRSGASWSPGNAPAGSGASGGSYFGYSVALSTDGTTAVVGGPYDGGRSGATWVFSRSGPGWSQEPKLTGGGESGLGTLGYAVAASADGSTVLAGGPGDAGNAGAGWVFAAPALPAAPTGVGAVSDVGQATVSFTPPAGSPTSYVVIAAPSGVTATGTASPIVVNGLANGATYTFRVVAVNAAGMGPASAASNAVTTPDVPGAPTAVAATAADGFATVTFTPPASDGGMPITAYTATASPGGRVGGGTGSPIVVSGLSNGVSYTFTVTATNAAGAGAPSSMSNAVVPTLVERPHPDPPAASPRTGAPAFVSPGTRPPKPVCAGCP